ncbi:MAG TPA: hypothetical protein VIM61_16040 [Chthoniobacterales bacterium]
MPIPNPAAGAPIPAMVVGVAGSGLATSGISGSTTFDRPVEVMRFVCIGALMVFCFFTMSILCSTSLLRGAGGPGLNDGGRGMNVCTTRYVATTARIT